MVAKVLPTETVISGPFNLYHGSFIIEFLKPDPSRNATYVPRALTELSLTSDRVLMRSTYKHQHPLIKKGKKHPQVIRFTRLTRNKPDLG